MAQKLRNACFTLFKYMDEDVDEETTCRLETNLKGCGWLGKIKYIIAGMETCPKTQKKHLQGYVEFNNPLSVKRIKDMLDKSVHLEARKGTSKQAADYCRKEDEYPMEMGERSAQGQRTDLESIFEEIKAGKKKVELAESYPTQWAYHRKAFEEYRDMVEPKRDWVTEVILITGPPGCGKTRKAIEDGATPIEIQGDFINGYDGEDVVLFDDVEPHTFQRYQFLKLFDRYPYKINVKGGSRNWKPRKVFITSNSSPKDILWDKAMERRVTEIIKLGSEDLEQKLSQ